VGRKGKKQKEGKRGEKAIAEDAKRNKV